MYHIRLYIYFDKQYIYFAIYLVPHLYFSTSKLLAPFSSE